MFAYNINVMANGMSYNLRNKIVTFINSGNTLLVTQ